MLDDGRIVRWLWYSNEEQINWIARVVKTYARFRERRSFINKIVQFKERKCRHQALKKFRKKKQLIGKEEHSSCLVDPTNQTICWTLPLGKKGSMISPLSVCQYISMSVGKKIRKKIWEMGKNGKKFVVGIMPKNTPRVFEILQKTCIDVYIFYVHHANIMTFMILLKLHVCKNLKCSGSIRLQDF